MFGSVFNTKKKPANPSEVDEATARLQASLSFSPLQDGSVVVRRRPDKARTAFWMSEASVVGGPPPAADLSEYSIDKEVAAWAAAADADGSATAAILTAASDALATCAVLQRDALERAFVEASVAAAVAARPKKLEPKAASPRPLPPRAPSPPVAHKPAAKKTTFSFKVESSLWKSASSRPSKEASAADRRAQADATRARDHRDVRTAALLAALRKAQSTPGSAQRALVHPPVAVLVLSYAAPADAASGACACVVWSKATSDPGFWEGLAVAEGVAPRSRGALWLSLVRRRQNRRRRLRDGREPGAEEEAPLPAGQTLGLGCGEDNRDRWTRVVAELESVKALAWQGQAAELIPDAAPAEADKTPAALLSAPRRASIIALPADLGVGKGQAGAQLEGGASQSEAEPQARPEAADTQPEPAADTQPPPPPPHEEKAPPRVRDVVITSEALRAFDDDGGDDGDDDDDDDDDGNSSGDGNGSSDGTIVHVIDETGDGGGDRPLEVLSDTGTGRALTFRDLIWLDACRTYHNYHPDVSSDPESVSTLARLLSALAYASPSVGYCQGQNFVAAFLLLHLPQHDAFALFDNLMSDPLYDLQALYTPGLPLVRKVLFVIDALIRETLPDVADHFAALELTASLWATGHVMTLFTALDVVPVAAVRRLFGRFVAVGWAAVYGAVLAAVFAAAPALLQADFSGCMTALRELSATLGGADACEAVLRSGELLEPAAGRLLQLEAAWVRERDGDGGESGSDADDEHAGNHRASFDDSWGGLDGAEEGGGGELPPLRARTYTA